MHRDPSLRQELDELKRIIAGVLPSQTQGIPSATAPPTTTGSPDLSPYLRAFGLKPSSSLKTFYPQASTSGEPPAFPPPPLDLSVQVGDPSPSEEIPSASARSNISGQLCPDVLSPAILNKIALDEYVDFRSLIPEPPQKPSYVSFELGARTVCNLLPPKKTKPLTKGEWSRAFCQFAAAYTKFFPSADADLFLYQNHILELMEVPGFDWAHLDFKFRSEKKQLQHGWRHIRQDLETKIHRGIPQLLSPSEEGGASKQFFPKKPARGKGIPVGYCIRYHSEGRSCSNKKACKYSHLCYRCEQGHPGFRPCGKSGLAARLGPGVNGKNSAANANKNSSA